MNTAIGARNLPRVVALAAALGMVAGGLLLRVSERASKGRGGNRELAAAPVLVSASRKGPMGRANTRTSAPGAGVRSAPLRQPLSPPKADRGVPGHEGRDGGLPQADLASGPPEAGLATSYRSNRTEGQRAVSLPAGRKATSPAALPPFLPPLYAPGAGEEMTGPPPGVLWLAGVIQGKPRLALLRRDENRYLVREGEMIEGRYRVVAISANSVTIQRGNRKQKLRLGQY